MSINYHAYQCRNYLLSDYEEIERSWKSSFSNYNPERVMQILHLKRDANYLYIKYFQTCYRLRLKDGTLEKQTDELHLSNLSTEKKQPSAASNTSSYVKIQNSEKLYLNPVPKKVASENGWTPQVYFNEAMVIYHLLYYVKEQACTAGIWIPNTNLDTRAGNNNQREDLLFTSFARQFSGKTEELSLACQAFGGTPLETKADVAYQFSAFPQVSLQLLFWDADEDFPAQVQVLVDKYITNYVHLETTGCMISDLFIGLTQFLN